MRYELAKSKVEILRNTGKPVRLKKKQGKNKYNIKNMKMVNKKRIKNNSSKSGKIILIKDLYMAMGEMMEKIKECRTLESHKLTVPMANSKKTLGRGVMFELNSHNEYFFLGKVKKVSATK